MPNRIFYALLALLIVAKVVLCSFLYSYNDKDQLLYDSAKFKFKHGFYHGGDDYEVFNSSIYYRHTDTILTYQPVHSFYKPSPRPDKPYKTAFRPKAYVYLHVYLVPLYEKITGLKIDTVDDKNMYNYLSFYGAILYFLSLILYAVSLYCFYRLLQSIFDHQRWARIGLLLYALIPSHLLFIGLFDSWENVSFYTQVIYISCLYLAVFGKRQYGWGKSLLIAGCVLVAFCRPHLLMTFGALIGFALLKWFLDSNRKQNRSGMQIAAISAIILLLGLIPIFAQNKTYFGKAFLSTQASFEFFQGHNEFARSSWNSHIYLDHKDYFDSAIYHSNIQNLEHLNLSEYEEGQRYMEYAKSWSLHNIGKEMMLSFKKVAGYFIPYNHLNNRLNFVTLFIELGFFAGVLLFLYFLRHFKSSKEQLWQFIYFFIPIIFTVCLTLMFFVGYRWRYYAEPFMLLLTLIVIRYILDKRNSQNKSI